MNEEWNTHLNEHSFELLANETSIFFVMNIVGDTVTATQRNKLKLSGTIVTR